MVPRFALAMYYLGKVPWHFVLIGLGIVLAVTAIVLSILAQDGALFAFVAAGLLILAGIVARMPQAFTLVATQSYFSATSSPGNCT